jgi:erythromycin esterase-like protein
MTTNHEELKAWDDDTALMGPNAPKWNGHIEHLICYLLTVHKRFGNTCITANLQWGATAMWKRDEMTERATATEAKLATVERETIERCAKAQCIHCMNGEQLSEDFHWHELPKGRVLCFATAIRALKTTESETCPFPILDDDGTAAMCIKNGHCGCDNRVADPLSPAKAWP